MSDHCRGCAYDVKAATGARACPFNYLYWDFIARHAERLARNPRMAMPLRTLSKMDPVKVRAMRAQASAFLDAPEGAPEGASKGAPEGAPKGVRQGELGIAAASGSGRGVTPA
jgi:deoxyribodipyrimidine photolyase-related protein